MNIERQEPISPEEALLEAQANGFLTEEDYSKWLHNINMVHNDVVMFAQLLREAATTIIHDPEHTSDKDGTMINGYSFKKCLCKNCTLARIGVETHGLV